MVLLLCHRNRHRGTQDKRDLLYTIWRQPIPDKHQDMDPKVNTQRRNIKAKKWLVNTELAEIKANVIRHIQQHLQQPENANIVDEKPSGSSLEEQLAGEQQQQKIGESISGNQHQEGEVTGAAWS